MVFAERLAVVGMLVSGLFCALYARCFAAREVVERRDRGGANSVRARQLYVRLLWCCVATLSGYGVLFFLRFSQAFGGIFTNHMIWRTASLVLGLPTIVLGLITVGALVRTMVEERHGCRCSGPDT